MEQYIKQTKRAFGNSNKCLGKELSLNIPKKYLKDFLENLDQNKRDLFNRSVVFYIVYMENISFLNNKLKNKKDVIDYFSYTVWSNMSISMIFSIIDEITMKEKGRSQYFSDFLKEHFAEMNKKEDIDVLRGKYDSSKLDSSTMTRLSNFYDENLEKNEKQKIISQCMAEDQFNGKIKINNIKDAIRQVYGKIRSGFLHNMKFDSLPGDSVIIIPEREGSARLLDNLNAGQFIYLSWKAIFRYFGYKETL